MQICICNEYGGMGRRKREGWRRWKETNKKYRGNDKIEAQGATEGHGGWRCRTKVGYGLRTGIEYITRWS
jgi:hypothetical protein